ncbi:MAG TPA: tRNA epoxyqueuosine(34) reductase QueG [Acidobacteriota bacterium]|nr:tRNA epoxyqueuosine(34) reductase QueG [Acidobacteriota bacterium]
MPSAHKTELAGRIREEALRLGFFKAGIAPAHRLPAGERFAKWLREGMHGEMAYLERQTSNRLDPGLVLEDARSILVLALNYYACANVPDSPLKGRISRYAWGDDYHEIILPRLEALLASIRKMQPAVQGLCYADTGPVMEKTWGAQTSIGWMGKNTTLISRESGSWFFIGVILLDIELECDVVAEDFCGQCDRCIHACPSGAIVAPYFLDARRCISYLTQLRGPIPRSLRPLMGNRIFGCDTCQEACPWNRSTPKTAELGFHPRDENLLPDLATLVGLSTDEFSKRFSGNPVHRVTRDGFVRNVVVALGNSGNREAVSPLEVALQDPSPLVRSHAAWALGRIVDERVPLILERARTEETDPLVTDELILAGITSP